MNQIILTGRLTGDPEYKIINDQKVSNFTIAVDHWKKDGSKACDFIPCTSFGKTAETVAAFLQKGSKLMVHGSLRTYS